MTYRTKIYVCGNAEILADGLIEKHYQYPWCELIDLAVQETCDMLRDKYEHEHDLDIVTRSTFRDWRGGELYRAGSVINGSQYGYRDGFVATWAINPSDELIRIIQEANDFLYGKLKEIGEQEDQEEKEDKESVVD